MKIDRELPDNALVIIMQPAQPKGMMQVSAESRGIADQRLIGNLYGELEHHVGKLLHEWLFQSATMRENRRTALRVLQQIKTPEAAAVVEQMFDHLGYTDPPLEPSQGGTACTPTT